MKNPFLKKVFCLLTAVLLITSSTILSGCNTNSSERAATWNVNTYAPTADTKGNVGDMWLNTSTYDIYQLTSDGWILCGNTKTEDGKNGLDGVNGKDGKDGVDGSAWFTGEGSPVLTNVEGKVGDLYFDTKGFKLYKMNSAGAWEYLTTLGTSDKSGY